MELVPSLTHTQKHVLEWRCLSPSGSPCLFLWQWDMNSSPAKFKTRYLAHSGFSTIHSTFSQPKYFLILSSNLLPHLTTCDFKIGENQILNSSIRATCPSQHNFVTSPSYRHITSYSGGPGFTSLSRRQAYLTWFFSVSPRKFYDNRPTSNYGIVNPFHVLCNSVSANRLSFWRCLVRCIESILK
jgi:hypothetical protein